MSKNSPSKTTESEKPEQMVPASTELPAKVKAKIMASAKANYRTFAAELRRIVVAAVTVD